ncbi:hypothetical protein QFC20_004456 [Naganishia adeliensis]|uniref:Uncharacterized protein n=1 Tax=Naganishia adeliensis TaxID=92952 RepID=A0ACC2W1M5_9TREE|nr:hypothetical protein QFC20_004456 [Naganishia adeliensis]
MADSNPDEISSVLFMAREALVYKVPPRTTTEGYRASTWNDQGFLWKGRVRVLEIGERCEIRLEFKVDAQFLGELFALTRYTPTNNAVEPVLDSSRYFVLRVEGEGGRKAYIGMGFEERGDAFDFNVALQTISKRTTAASEPVAAKEEVKDYSLKDGQTFSIKIPGRERRRAEATSEGSGGGMMGAGGVPLLAPPPPSTRKR